eukprot:TRINITY_DN28243_c0_g1_i1.p1 TRINITY_DN28243_c0_g1~~TRINITY_DN28243_c0_g1_i1.p1  ORF type:complete len:865 (-),score=205.91 TRINITY_DN28243_c0_g1_i1:702-3170(-)
MDAELLELQRQFQAAQEAKPSVRLSERNIVELVNKLRDLELLDSDLLHTLSGKEYITREHLKTEIKGEIDKRGRVSLIELADTIGVDLYHVERQAESIVKDRKDLMLVQGEILSNSYWDSVAEEISERLEHSSQIALAELAAQLHVSSELLSNILESRLGNILQGKMEGGRLYTPLYVSRVKAMIRGAVRGVMVPTNLSSIWASLHQLLQEMDGVTSTAVENSFFQNLLNSLVKEGELLGSLRTGMVWTPAVFAVAQQESVESFFSQNSFIGYDVLAKLAILQPKQYLQSKYPEGIALDTMFVHPSMIEMLDASIEDTISHGGWLDCLSILPTSIGAQDGAKLLTHCPSVQHAIKGGRGIIMTDTCVVSNDFLQALFAQLESETEIFMRERIAVSQKAYLTVAGNKPGTNDGKDNHSNYVDGMDEVDKRPRRKKGKETSSTKVAVGENEIINQSSKGGKSKKKQGSSKGRNPASSGTKTDQQKRSQKDSNDFLDGPSEEWILERVLHLYPDIENAGAGEEGLNGMPAHLAAHMRPMLISSWKNKRNAILAEGAEKRRQLLEKLQKHLDEAYLNLQLFAKALELFEDDTSVYVILHRHLLRTVAAEITDKLLFVLDMDKKMQDGYTEDISQDLESISFNAGERISLAKDLPGPLSSKAAELVEALDGKHLDAFDTALKSISKESGLWLKKLDKRSEKALLQAYSKHLKSQVEEEGDPVALLPKIVVLLYVQVYNKALQIPGRAIAIAISRLKDHIPEKAYITLTEYHSATVNLLSLLSAGSYSDDDCTADRILTKRELLGSKMSELKLLISSMPSGSLIKSKE